MDIAIVTGAETPLGLSLIQRLVRQGYRVHGIGNNFAKVTYADPQFKAHPVDLSKLAEVTQVMQGILDEEKRLDLLIHAIDVTPGGSFEKLPVGNLEAILKIGLLGPVMLTRLALPNLLRFRGQLINVIPANKSGCPASAVNALLEGGLREMNRALFDRARDAGLRVTNLVLRQNPEPDGLEVKSSEQTHIDLEDVARSVEQLIDPNFTNVPSELVLHPRTSAQSVQSLPEWPEPIDPYSEVVLPPKEYCPPAQPKIPTEERQKVERSIPYTDDEMEDKIAAAIEDFEAHPERYEKPEPQPERSSPQGKRPEQMPPQGKRPESQDEAGSNKRRRGRRRGGRNRNRDRDPDTRPPQESGAPKSEEGGARDNRDDQGQALQPRERREPKDASQKQAKPERGNGGKRSTVRESSAQAGSPEAKAPAKKAAKKAPVKKAPAKKAAKKAPVKKAPAKKAAKQTSAKQTSAKQTVKKTVKKKAAKKAPVKKAE